MSSRESKPFETKSLTELITALSQEVSRSSLASDLTREEMRKVYDNHPILKGSEPCKVRVVSMKVNLPLALDEHLDLRKIDSGLSNKQAVSLISSDVDPVKREKIAADIVASLERQKKNRFGNPNLAKDIRKAFVDLKLERAVAAKHLDLEKLEAMRKDWKNSAVVENDTKFIYKARDLRRIGSENLIRFEIDIDVS